MIRTSKFKTSFPGLKHNMISKFCSRKQTLCLHRQKMMTITHPYRNTATEIVRLLKNNRVWSVRYCNLYNIIINILKKFYKKKKLDKESCNLIKIKSLTCCHLLICHCVGDLMTLNIYWCVTVWEIWWHSTFTDVSLCGRSDDTQLQVTWPYVPANENGNSGGMKMLLNYFACYEQSN